MTRGAKIRAGLYTICAALLGASLFGGWVAIQDWMTFTSPDAALVAVHSLVTGVIVCMALAAAGGCVSLMIDIQKLFTDDE